MVIADDEEPNATKLKFISMKTMLLETKLRDNTLVAKHEELEKQGMNDGDGDDRSRGTIEIRNAHNDDNVD